MKRYYLPVVTIFSLLVLASCVSSPAETTTTMPIDDIEPWLPTTPTSETLPHPTRTNNSSEIQLEMNPEAPETWTSAIDTVLQQAGPHGLRVEIEKLAGNPLWGLDLLDLEFDGNEQKDIALSLSTQSLENPSPRSLVLVIRCGSERCEIVHQQMDDLAAADHPQLSAQDLNGDGMTDLLVSIRHCGAHTCFLDVEALAWHEGSIRNIFTGPTDDLPNPELRLIGPLENGQFTIEITATGIGSAGAGPFRQFTRTWTWAEEQSLFIPGMDVYQDPEYRIHQLHDADELFAADDLEAARAAYLRVIQDDDLSDWVSDGASLGAYAYYRIGLITLMTNGEAATQNPFAELESAHPPGMEGSAYSDLAGVFWDTFAENRDWASACLAAIEYAREHEQTIIEPLYYGYANKAYKAEDMCPIGE